MRKSAHLDAVYIYLGLSYVVTFFVAAAICVPLHTVVSVFLGKQDLSQAARFLISDIALIGVLPVYAAPMVILDKISRSLLLSTSYAALLGLAGIAGVVGLGWQIKTFSALFSLSITICSFLFRWKIFSLVQRNSDSLTSAMKDYLNFDLSTLFVIGFFILFAFTLWLEIFERTAIAQYTVTIAFLSLCVGTFWKVRAGL